MASSKMGAPAVTATAIRCRSMSLIKRTLSLLPLGWSGRPREARRRPTTGRQTMTASLRDAAVTAARFPLRPAASADRPAPAGHWLRVAAAVAVIGWGANQFTPLLLLYRPLMGLTAAMVEAMFGMYAIGLIPGLLVAGRVSDRIGRPAVGAARLRVTNGAAARGGCPGRTDAGRHRRPGCAPLKLSGTGEAGRPQEMGTPQGHGEAPGKWVAPRKRAAYSKLAASSELASTGRHSARSAAAVLFLRLL